MQKKQNWMYASICAIILSIISLFLPVIIYTSKGNGITSYYNVIKFFNSNDIINTVFDEYCGDVVMGEEAVSALIFIICLIGVAAIVCAFIGIRSMTKQYESVWPFRLALCGLIGTVIPSLSLIIFYLASFRSFEGNMRLGAYIFVTPIAMIIACINVTNRHRLTQQELALQNEARKYIRPAGNLK